MWCVKAWLTRKFKEIKFQHARNNGYLVMFKHVFGNGFAMVDGISEVMGGCQRHVDQPNASSDVIAFEVRVVWPILDLCSTRR